MWHLRVYVRGLSGLLEKVEEIIDSWIFSERNRAIAKRKLLDAITYEDLACEFGLSDRQIKRIIYKCEQIILRHV